VSPLSRAEVGRKAGVDPAYIDRLVEVGILAPSEPDAFSPGDVLRARWVRGWEQAGVPLDRMAEAVRDGRLSFTFLDVPAFDRFTALSTRTFREVSEATGVPTDLLKVVREAFGFAEPRPDDLLREDELAVLPAIEVMLASAFRPIVIERWLRVCADNLRRIVETEDEWWRTEVEEPLLRSMAEVDMLAAQADLGSHLAPLVEEALIAIYRGQQEHVWSESVAEIIEGTLEKAGLAKRVQSPPAVSFLDITGYTRLTEEHGDTAAVDLANQLSDLVRRTANENGGRPVKWLGDGVMFVFKDPGPGVMAALEMVEGVETSGLPPAHVGIHAGPVVFEGGDYFGRTVNIAARIGEYARPGEVVVSRQVVDASEGMTASFTEIGPVELKGVSEPLRLYVARKAGTTNPP
jgi:class 3 adenylate cyclase